MSASPMFAGLEKVQMKWGWFLVLGISLIALGLIALGDTVAATVVSVMLLGWLFLFSAAFHLIKCFHARAWQGFFLDLLGFIFDLVLGGILLLNPAVGAVSLTLVLAAFFLAGGLMRLFGAVAYDVPHKGWATLDGIVTTLLGILLFIHWPASGLWFIGFAVGVALIFRGWSWVMLAMSLHRRSESAQPA